MNILVLIDVRDIMTNISDVSCEKFRRVKINMKALKKPDFKVDPNAYIPMMVNTMVMVVEILDDMIEGEKK